MRLVPEREHWLPEILDQIPHLEIVRDHTRNARDSFLRNLLLVGDDAAVYLEDDIILTRDFTTKVEAVIAERPQHVINFFSLRDDAAKGPRLMRGGSFSMNQCFYMPPGYASLLYDYHARWPERTLHRAACDLFLGSWLKSRGESYWQHVPSLVQHRVARSVIDPRRSSKRQSRTFVA